MNPQIKIFVLPGGEMPQRESEGAIGYDARLRAIVSPTEMDEETPYLRKPLFNFRDLPKIDNVCRNVYREKDDLVYRLEPGEQVLGGLGFVTEMPPKMFYWVTPRSGLASKYGIRITNAPGTVDPDYRGEAGACIYNGGDKPFDLKLGMRITQVIFQWAIMPDMVTLRDYAEFSKSERGAGGFGSTGLNGTNEKKVVA